MVMQQGHGSFVEPRDVEALVRRVELTVVRPPVVGPREAVSRTCELGTAIRHLPAPDGLHRRLRSRAACAVRCGSVPPPRKTL